MGRQERQKKLNTWRVWNSWPQSQSTGDIWHGRDKLFYILFSLSATYLFLKWKKTCWCEKLMGVTGCKFVWDLAWKGLRSAVLVTDSRSSTSLMYLVFWSFKESDSVVNWNILSCSCPDLDRCLADKLVTFLDFFTDPDGRSYWIIKLMHLLRV